MGKSPQNPPAFPVAADRTVFQAGMTLRDYFAAKALQGIMANIAVLGAIGSQRNGTGNNLDAAKQSDLNISSRLLALARIIPQAAADAR